MVCLFAETPGVTHIVYPFGAKGDPDDGQEYLRCLEKRSVPLAQSTSLFTAVGSYIFGRAARG